MPRHPAPAKADADPRLVRAAAEWRSRHDAGLAPADEAAFVRWLEADPRHAEAFAQLNATWSLLDRASEIAPAELGWTDGAANPEASRAGRARRRRLVAAWTASLAAAAAIVVGTALGWRSSAPPPDYVNVAAVAPDLVKRLNLPDGSIARLNSDTVAEFRFSASHRRVVLARGEASFVVAADASRPFIVSIAGIDVRAVGTAFNVALRANVVEVLVTEGRVSVADAAGGGSLLSARAATTAVGQAPSLAAGEKVVIPVEERVPPVAVAPVAVAPIEIARTMAWQERRLDFEAAPLTEIVAAFNRYNHHQLVVADAALGRQRYGGSFRADEPETFVRLIETRSGVLVERKPNETVLRLVR